MSTTGPSREETSPETKRLLHEFITEHYGFAPESFTSRAVDIANDVIYDTMDKVEDIIVKKYGESHEVDLGLHRLETLLEGLVDYQFDLCELYLLRNVFKIEPKYLSFVRMHSGDKKTELINEKDAEDLLELVREEKRQVEKQLDFANDVRVANAIVEQRIASLKACKEELSGWGLLGDRNVRLGEHVDKTLEYMPEFRKQTTKLVESPLQGSSTTKDKAGEDKGKNVNEPWRTREEYIAWAIGRKLAPDDKLMDDVMKSAESRGKDKQVKGMLKALERS